MAFVAFYDACVLHPQHLRDLLIRLANIGLFQAKWSAGVLDEMERSLVKRFPDVDPARFPSMRERMEGAIEDGLVSGYEILESALDLPDPDDRHVLAAAIRASAQVIVTANLRDFPRNKLAPFDIEAQHPDVFVGHIIDLAPSSALEVVGQIADATGSQGNRKLTSLDLLDLLVRDGLPVSAAELRKLMATAD